jgi:tRNA modification GTPase
VTRYSVLTPAGTGAIAVVAVRGPGAWDATRRHFRPSGKPLPESPVLHSTRFGTLGDGAGDEVVIAVTAVSPEVSVEIQCHGGPQVVRMVAGLLEQAGCVRAKWWELSDGDPELLRLLAAAPTLRNAAIILDQLHGAYGRAVMSRDPLTLERLRQLAPVGRHLVVPWDVVLVGVPNAGKSSLVNALAGFQRSIVTATPGTTRDIVRVELAFDGVPVRLTDTAGLRDTPDELEAEGVRRATASAASADLTIEVIDGTAPCRVDLPPSARTLAVWNKADLAAPPSGFDGVIVSAVTGDGLRGLISAVVNRLEPLTPVPGEAVPYGRFADELAVS